MHQLKFESYWIFVAVQNRTDIRYLNQIQNIFTANLTLTLLFIHL